MKERNLMFCINKLRDTTQSCNYKGFTLAETLITLVIIGVVAALTVPTLIAKHRAQQFSSRLKSSYSMLGQLVNNMNSQEMKLTITDNYPTGTVFPVALKYLNSVGSEGRVLSIQPTLKKYHTYNNADIIHIDWFDDGMIDLLDGTTLFIQNHSQTKVMLSIDLNGRYKKPNQLGKDLFMFEILNSGNLVPMGSKGTTYTNHSTYCSDTSTNRLNGSSCTVKALQDEDYFKKNL